MRIVAILQARMNSTRLPGKMLLPLLVQPLVRHVIERVRRAAKLDFVVLAYPLMDNPSFAPILKSFTDTPGVPLGSWAHQGDENDLVERYLRAAEAYGADVIVRIPCDNPCVDPFYIDQAVEDYLDTPHVFLSNTTEYIQSIRKYVDGVGCEVLSMSRLKWLDRITQGQSALREHPHKYFLDRYRDNDAPDCGIAFGKLDADIRLDVNTQQEYECIEDIYNHFGHNRFRLDEIVSYLTTKEVPHESIEREQPSGNSQQRA